MMYYSDDVKGPFQGLFSDQIDVSTGKYGACDPRFLNIRQAVSPYRYSRGLLSAVVVDANTISLATTQLRLFTAGSTQAGQGYPAGQILSIAETNADRDGALAKSKQAFKIRSAGFRVLTPMTLTAQQQGLSGFEYNAALNAHQRQIQSFLHENLAASLTFQDADCNLVLGPILNMPAPYNPTTGGSGSEGIVTNTSLGVAGQMLFRAAVLTQDALSSDKMELLVETFRPATFVVPNANLPFQPDTVISIPVEAFLLGEPVCMPCATPCPPGTAKATLQTAVNGMSEEDAMSMLAGVKNYLPG